MFLRGRGTRAQASSSRLILVTGGARAGKSRFAQELAERYPFVRRLYVATAVPCDREMRLRIARHRARRGGGWTTLEEPTRLPERLPGKLPSGSVLLFDCLPTFVTNLLLEGHSSSQVRCRVRALVRACRRPGWTAVFVSNEVGWGIVPEGRLSRRFRDLLGEINQGVAASADEVYLAAAGIPVRIK